MKKIFQILPAMLIFVCFAWLNSSAYAADGSYSAKVYHEQGGDTEVVASGGDIKVESGGIITVESGGTIDLESGAIFEMGSDTLTATGSEINNAADVSARVEEITVSGNVTAGVQSTELNHTSVTIAAVIADFATHQGLYHAKTTTEPPVGNHTITLTSGTWNGTNTIATFEDDADALVVYVDSVGNGTISVNVGSVALSGP